MKTIYCPDCLHKNINYSIQNHELNNCENCGKSLLLNNRYLIYEIIGQNSGTTYLGYDTENSQKTVIKELSIKKMSRWKEEELFQRERIVLASINHPNIPRITDKFDTKKGKRTSYYTVIEYIDGQNLSKIIEEKKFTEEEIIDFILNMADILEHIHKLTPPVIHRDIKPSNIIIKDNQPYLIDFGSVTNIIKEEGGSTIAGTFGYMAPEQFSGKANKSTDYYALGILSLTMLTQKQPEEFLDNNIIDWSGITISYKLKNIIKKLTNYNYKNRISTKEELQKTIHTSIPEIEYDIIKILKKYDEVYTIFKKIDEIKWYEFLYLAIGIYGFFEIYQKSGGVGFIFYLLFYPSVSYIIHRIKGDSIFKKQINKFLDDTENSEFNISIMTLFIKKEMKKRKSDVYYSQLEKGTSVSLDLNKLLTFENLFTEINFTDKHIKKYKKYGKTYIKFLEERISNKNYNFNITNKEVDEYFYKNNLKLPLYFG